MEISLLKVLLKNISCFIHMSSSENVKFEPVQKYYGRIEELLKWIKPVLDAVVNAELPSDEQLQKLFAGLSQSVVILRELFESSQPLMSRFYFVMQIESLLEKVRNTELEILELLRSSEGCLSAGISVASLEQYIEKLKLVRNEQMPYVITKAIKDQVEGTGPSPDDLAKIADCLKLMSNQELLIEAVALEKLKENAEQAERNGEVDYIDQMIALVTYMHDRLVSMKQSQSCNPVQIPPDFRCPLSLELMTYPVIVASGQTYERAFIRKWLDLGLTVCPKTRQSLAHTNLIPNYTVKALIANWCESNNVKLPDPMESISSNQPCFVLKNMGSGASGESHVLANSRGNQPAPAPADFARSFGSVGDRKLYNETHGDETSPSHHHSSSEDSSHGVALNGVELDIERVSLENLDDRLAHPGDQGSTSPSRNDLPMTDGATERSLVHHQSSSASSTHSDLKFSQGVCTDRNESSSGNMTHTGDVSGESISEPKPEATPPASQRYPEFHYRLEPRSRSQTIWRRPSDRFPRIVSSPTIENRADLSGVESQVRNLVEDLKSDSIQAQINATAELRLLAKHNMDNRLVIANCGAISLLVDLLGSPDSKIQENAVTALLNLSINDNNKTAIANADAIVPLIQVLQNGSPEAKENSAATLFSLSVMDDNKIKIGRFGAIKPLVDLLGNGTPRGKRDAATALFNLSICHENKARIVQAGAVKYLVELMDPAAGMVDKAVAVLSNLSTIPEGRMAIGQDGGIPLLVEVVELGSARGKENAAAALLQLCTNSGRYCNMVLQEGAVPPLVALSQSGTPRAKEKAQGLLNYFRTQRHGNAGRG